MSLSCSCDDDYDWYYTISDVQAGAPKNCKCYGCCKKLLKGEQSRVVDSWEIDEEGDENQLTDHWLCESCGDLYDSLIELGFCLVANWGFIAEAHREYKDDYLPREHE